MPAGIGVPRRGESVATGGLRFFREYELTVDMVLKRAMKGRLDIMGPAMAVQKELMSIPEFGDVDDTPFASEKKLIRNLKKTIMMVAGAAAVIAAAVPFCCCANELPSVATGVFFIFW